MGAQKGCPIIQGLIEFVEKRNQFPHFNNQTSFLGELQHQIMATDATIVDGRLVGIKTKKNKQILLEDVLGEGYLDLDESAYGIYIPAEQILTRPKYQWFAYLSSEEVLATNAIITKYLKASAVNEYTKDASVKKSVTTI